MMLTEKRLTALEERVADLEEEERSGIDLLLQEHLYVVERLHAGTMDMKEAREWLKRHGHD